jgi:acetylornithine deacetylase/succinyl-diaminopimelate desuccinylase-like protein
MSTRCVTINLFKRHQREEQKETLSFKHNNYLMQPTVSTYFLRSITMLFISSFLYGGLHAQTTLTSNQQLARDLFKELIEINTTHATGNTTDAANAMAKRLLAAGFAAADIQVVGPNEHNKNLVVRLHGKGDQKPVLYLAHFDVVEAKREDWSVDPFKFIEKDGFFYGRGSMDIKDGAAILLADFIRLKQEGIVPGRDFILALTAGEESGAEYDGVEWLINNKRSLIDAAFCINVDGGDPQMKDGKRLSRTVQASEKQVLNVQLEARNKGGHSSEPVKDNAIYHLSQSLINLQQYEFPVILSDVTKAYFGQMAAFEQGQVAADMRSIASGNNDTAAIQRLATASPYYNALMRTTCVATMLEGGHAMNALPQMARAIVNCRVLPGSTQQEIVQAIHQVVADSQVAITVINGLIENPSSPLQPEVMQPITSVTNTLWPGVLIVPTMEVGATDGLYLRGADIPTYGVSGVFLDMDDNRAHGRDERVGVKEFYDGLEYEYRLMKAFAGKK